MFYGTLGHVYHVMMSTVTMLGKPAFEVAAAESQRKVNRHPDDQVRFDEVQVPFDTKWTDYFQANALLYSWVIDLVQSPVSTFPAPGLVGPKLFDPFQDLLIRCRDQCLIIQVFHHRFEPVLLALLPCVDRLPSCF